MKPTKKSKNLYPLEEVRKRAGYNVYELRKRGHIPLPTHRVSKGSILLHYTSQEIDDIIEDLNRNYKPNNAFKDLKKEGWRSLKELAEAVGCSHLNISYHVKRGHVPGPTHDHPIISGGKLYNLKEFNEAIKIYNKRWINRKSQWHKRGYRTQGDIAKALNCWRSTVGDWRRKGWFAAPTHDCSCQHKLYTLSEFNKIVKHLKKRR